jgi:predicted AAA+ superfamily ATPase
MRYIKRILDLQTLLLNRSVLLFGPRQSGKSTYIAEQLKAKPAKTYNLLNRALYAEISRDPTRIRQEVEGNGWNGQLIAIDEIQKIPELLDEVHLMIEKFVSS